MLPEARENAKGGASSLHQSDSESKNQWNTALILTRQLKRILNSKTI